MKRPSLSSVCNFYFCVQGSQQWSVICLKCWTQSLLHRIHGIILVLEAVRIVSPPPGISAVWNPQANPESSSIFLPLPHAKFQPSTNSVKAKNSRHLFFFRPPYPIRYQGLSFAVIALFIFFTVPYYPHPSTTAFFGVFIWSGLGYGSNKMLIHLYVFFVCLVWGGGE